MGHEKEGGKLCVCCLFEVPRRLDPQGGNGKPERGRETRRFQLECVRRTFKSQSQCQSVYEVKSEVSRKSAPHR